MIRDFNVEWSEVIEYLPAQAFQTFVTGAGIAAGAPVFQEISTSGISGIQINQAADSIATFWHMGNHVDIKKQIRFRVWWSKNSTDADAETATVLYTPVVAGTTAIAAPATALSTAIPSYTFGTTANVAEVTDFGIIARATLPDTTAGLLIDVASTMTNASADEISLLGLEIRYTPRRTGGPRRNLLGGRRWLTTRPQGTLLATAQEAAS